MKPPRFFNLKRKRLSRINPVRSLVLFSRFRHTEAPLLLYSLNGFFHRMVCCHGKKDTIFCQSLQCSDESSIKQPDLKSLPEK
ncbi:hypothetical protein ACFP3I_13975 [Chryseobacterium arachidis]|uniref:hypothetical protein n=1 Tax=Chryseobacterium arachidis TaxID=1416778 RepID=UPI00361B791E